MAGAYQVFVVDQTGTPFTGSGPDGELANAAITRLSWELNTVGAAEIQLATSDADAALMLPGREIQIWRDGAILWWGPIIRPQATLRTTTWQCADLLWYFGHRFMGRADRTNQLSNGDFESGETGWDFSSGVTHSVNTDPTYILEGTKSEKLTGATASHATYASQTYTHPSGGYPGGDYLTGAVWVYIPSAAYLGPAISSFGLLLRHHNSGGTIVDSQGGPGSTLPAIIDDNTPQDQWVQLRTGVALVQAGDTVDFLLFPPHGDAYFDDATLTFMESLSFGFPSTPADVTDIIDGIVTYAQDTASGKSDLNIAIPGSPTATGTTMQVAYQFAEHRNILDAIQQYVTEGICDISIEVTSTTRTFTVWPKSADSRTPKQGKGTAYGTTLELDVNIADFTYSSDLEQAASSVVLLGPGDGPDRPEGGAVDSSFVGGVFTTEIVEQAPDNTTIGQLDLRAAERLAIAAHPEIVEVTTDPHDASIGTVTVGDTATVVIDLVDVNAVYRVARIDINPHTDQATYTMNAIPS